VHTSPLNNRQSRRPEALQPKSDFIGLKEIVHLAAAGECPYLLTHATVAERFAMDKSAGMAGRQRILDQALKTTTAVAGLLGVHHREIGFPLNVAQAMNMVARTVVDAGPGNVVMCSWEYPSLLYPWARLHDIELRLVRRNDCLDALPGIQSAVDNSTRAIVVSHVSYFTGERIDLIKYREAADRVGAMLIVDASHSLGVLPVDARLTDFLFSCCYKWLLGVHGVAIAFCNRERQPDWQPVEAGWTSVEWQDSRSRSGELTLVNDGRLFELGNLALLNVCILGNAVEYLSSVEETAIERHVMILGEMLGAELRELGVQVLTPREEPRRGASIVFSVEDEKYWYDGLTDAGILAWVGEGRVRLSPFLYTDWNDTKTAIRVISRLAREAE
jgi:selenocysteine lyase/cysteine desulfurase